MSTVTLSGKHQVTLPIDMVGSLGLKTGDKLVVEVIDWRIVLMKESENTIERLKGSMNGVYGSTLEEIDRYLAEERRSLERDEWREPFDDLRATDANARAVVEALRSFDHCKADSNRLLKRLCDDWKKKVDAGDIEEACEKLVKHGGVRKIPSGVKTPKEVYRLVREFAKQ